MDASENPLTIKIRARIQEFLRDGSVVAAIKFYRDVTMASLVESKQFIESFQLDDQRPVIDDRLRPFFHFLEMRDFGGAAACLCANRLSPGESIAATLRIARLLNVDVSQLELPESSGLSLSESAHAHSIINERALEYLRLKMVQQLVEGGTKREEAEKCIDDAQFEFAKNGSASPNPTPNSFEGVEPQLAHILSLLLGPVPSESSHSSQTNRSLISRSKTQLESTTLDATGNILLSRVGKIASLLYAMMALVGIGGLGLSYLSMPTRVPFSMPQDLLVTDQQERIDTWKDQNLPSTIAWFDSSMSASFFPVRLEPDLPLEYSNEDWTWEKKIASINVSAKEIDAWFKRCHELLLVLYSIAILLALYHWYCLDRISSILMVFLGLLGIPFLVTQIWRMEFQNPLWLAPLVIPGTIALIASVLDLAWFAPRMERKKELRAFWLGACFFAVSGIFLCWAIADGHHLRPAAGLGLFGGVWLMIQHGWKYCTIKEESR